MKIQIMSDIHREFLPGDEEENDDLKFSNECEILCIAGDISTSGNTEKTLNELKIPKNIQTLAVYGNHDHWVQWKGTHPALNKNIKILNRDIEIIQNQRFLGLSLWYDPKKTHTLAWSDFYYYSIIEIQKNHKKDIEFLLQNLSKGDVVLTHFLPSYRSIHSRWIGNKNNCFFVGAELEELILEREPKLWIHGHTHESMDYFIGKTRVVCNPYGYYNLDQNPNYNHNLIVEI